ncbi:MAG: M48 family metalloprotease [Planctomycetales bacterium]|nr:M48 family metalloprotease [Planctomycetales bacterium]
MNSWFIVCAIHASALSWLNDLLLIAWRTCWQSAILFVAISVLLLLLRDHIAPRWRYWLWGMVFCRLVLLTTPPSPLSVYNWIGSEYSAASSTHISDGFTSRESVSPIPPSSDASNTGTVDRIDEEFYESESRLSSDQGLSLNVVPTNENGSIYNEASFHGVAEEPAVMQSPGWQWPKFNSRDATIVLLTIVWLAGLFYFGAIQLVALTCLRRLVHESRTLKTGRAYETMLSICHKLQMRTLPRLLVSPGNHSPFVVGICRSSIVLPRSELNSLDDAQLRAVLGHELTHIRRRDVLNQWLILIIRTIYWFHPAAWLTARAMRLCSEAACDDSVMQDLTPDQRRQYGLTLLHMLEEFCPPNVAPGLCGMLTSKHLVRYRIMRVAMDVAETSKTRRRMGNLFGLLLIVGVALFGLTDAIQPTEAQAAPQEAGDQAAASTTLQGTFTQPTDEDFNNTIASFSQPTTSAEPIQRFGSHNPLDTLGSVHAFLADSSQLITSHERNGHVTVWNLQSQSIDWTSPPGHEYLAVSPDKRFLATQSRPRIDDNVVVTIFDLHDFTVHWHKSMNRLEEVTFSPLDNTVLLLTDGQQPLRMLDIDDGTEIGTLYFSARDIQEHDGTPFSLDGRYVAASGSSKITMLWDLQTGEHSALPAPQSQRSSAQKLAFVRGHQLVCAYISVRDDGQSGTVYRIMDVDARTHLMDLDLSGLPNPSLDTLCVSDDGTTLATLHGNRIVLWDTADWTRTRDLELPSIENGRSSIPPMAISPNNRLLAVNYASSLELWDLTTGQRLDSDHERHKGNVTDIALSPDGQQMASSGSDGVVYLWDTTSGKQIRKLLQESWSVSELFFLDQDELIVSGESLVPKLHGFVEWLKVSDGSRVRRKDLNGRNFGIAIINDRSTMAVASGSAGDFGGSPSPFGGTAEPGNVENQIEILGVDDGQVHTRISGFQTADGSNNRLLMSSDNSKLVLFDGNQYWRWNVDAESPKAHKSLYELSASFITNERERAGSYCKPLADIDKGLVWVSLGVYSRMGGSRQQAVCFDIETDRIEWIRRVDEGVIRHFQLSPDSRVLAVGIGGGQTMASSRIVLLEPETGRELQLLSSDQMGEVSALRFSNDGRQLYTGKMTGDILVWDVTPAQEALDVK